jgi:hypothetical protein
MSKELPQPTTMPTPTRRPRVVDLKPCFALTGILIVTALVIWSVFSALMVRMMRNNEQYYKFCIDANEHQVRPFRTEAELANPQLFMYGYWALDYPQLEVRWQLSGPQYNVTYASIDLRGPTTHSHEEVAPVAFAMGLQRDRRNRHYEGIVEISGELATDIVTNRFRYYVSAQDADGREVARDYLTKLCQDNL